MPDEVVVRAGIKALVMEKPGGWTTWLNPQGSFTNNCPSSYNIDKNAHSGFSSCLFTPWMTIRHDAMRWLLDVRQAIMASPIDPP